MLGSIKYIKPLLLITFFNVATRKYRTIYMAHITILLDSMGLDNCVSFPPDILALYCYNIVSITQL